MILQQKYMNHSYLMNFGNGVNAIKLVDVFCIICLKMCVK